MIFDEFEKETVNCVEKEPDVVNPSDTKGDALANGARGVLDVLLCKFDVVKEYVPGNRATDCVELELVRVNRAPAWIELFPGMQPCETLLHLLRVLFSAETDEPNCLNIIAEVGSRQGSIK